MEKERQSGPRQLRERGNRLWLVKYPNPTTSTAWFTDDKTGVNTGFGGSANTRTAALEELQRLLVRGLRYGMLGQPAGLRDERSVKDIQDITSFLLDDPVTATCMPESWVRASMLVRLNSLVSGASVCGRLPLTF
jgi:Aromatic amino acid lyase